MINRWLETLTDEQLDRILTEPVLHGGPDWVNNAGDRCLASTALNIQYGHQIAEHFKECRTLERYREVFGVVAAPLDVYVNRRTSLPAGRWVKMSTVGWGDVGGRYPALCRRFGVTRVQRVVKLRAGRIINQRAHARIAQHAALANTRMMENRVGDGVGV